MRADRAIWYLAVAQTILWAGAYYIFPALLLRWEGDFGWSKAEITMGLTLAVGLSALFSPVTGRWIDRGSGPAVLGISALICAAMVSLLSLVTEKWQFYTIWSVMGFAMAGALYEPCFALVMKARPAQAKRGITIITLLAGFAGTISFPMTHGIAEIWGWRFAALALGGMIGLIAVPLLWRGAVLLERNGEGEVETAYGQLPIHHPGFLKRPEFWLLAVGFAFLALNHGIALNHLLPLLNERSIQPETAVLAAAMIGPMQVAGRLAMMVAERHVSPVVITSACFIAVIFATLCLMGAAAVPILIVGFVLLQGSGFGVTSIMKPVVTREIMGPRNFGTVNGAAAMFFLAAFAVSAFLGSLIWEAGGYDLVLVSILVMAMIGLFFYWGAEAIVRRRRDWRGDS